MHTPKPRTAQSFGTRNQFLAEARRIRELEAREDSLTTIQGLLVSTITYNMNSMDEIGFSYIVQAISMGDRMKIFNTYPSTMDDKSKVSRGLTAWGAFHFQALFSFRFFRPPLIKSRSKFPLLDPSDNPLGTLRCRSCTLGVRIRYLSS